MVNLNPRKTGNVYPIQFQLLDNGVPITDAATSSCSLTMTNAMTGQSKVSNYGMTLVDGPTAIFQWTPLSTHVDTGAQYIIEINQLRADSSTRTFPSDDVLGLLIRQRLT